MDDFDLSLDVMERGEKIVDALNECNREMSEEKKNSGKENSTHDK